MTKGPSRTVLVLYAAAVLVVGVFAPGALWSWGYRWHAPFLPILFGLWILEIVVYGLLSRRGTLGSLGGILLGMFSRVVMAGVAAVLQPGTAAWSSAFRNYYCVFWLGALLQVIMAAMLVWLASEMVPAVRELAEDAAGGEARRARPELLDELMAQVPAPRREGRRPARHPEALPRPEVPGAGRVAAADTEARTEAPREALEAAAEEAEAPAAEEPAASEPAATEPDEAGAKEPASPFPDERIGVSDQDTSEFPPVEAPPKRTIFGRREPRQGRQDREAREAREPRRAAGAAPQVSREAAPPQADTTAPAAAGGEAEGGEPTPAPGGAEEPAATPTGPAPEAVPAPGIAAPEVGASDAAATGDELVTAAVLQAVRSASGADDVRLLWLPGAAHRVLANPPPEADEGAVGRAVLEAAGALAMLTGAGLLGAPSLAVALFRSGGTLMVPAMGAMVALRTPPARPLGALVLQGRRLGAALQANWPAPEDVGGIEKVDLGAASPTCEALTARAAEAGYQIGWYAASGASGLGDFAVVASGGTSLPSAAAASGVLWRALQELGRQSAHSLPRRALVCCERGAVALAAVKRADGRTLHIVRVATAVQPGTASAELESLVALCQDGGAEQ